MRRRPRYANCRSTHLRHARFAEIHQYCCGRCHVRLPRRYHLACAECGHPYLTRWHLWLAYLREHGKLWWRDWRGSGPAAPPAPLLLIEALGLPTGNPRTRWWHLFLIPWRPGRVTFCQCCIHDL